MKIYLDEQGLKFEDVSCLDELNHTDQRKVGIVWNYEEAEKYHIVVTEDKTEK